MLPLSDACALGTWKRIILGVQRADLKKVDSDVHYQTWLLVSPYLESVQVFYQNIYMMNE